MLKPLQTMNTINQQTVVLDAMGGDDAPAVAVAGAVQAARDFGLTVRLVGQPTLIAAELAKHDVAGLQLPITPASQMIAMDEHPASAVKNKPDSSIVVAMESVKCGQSAAFVSAGNSGGVMTAALLNLGRIKGIKRPALATIFPSRTPLGFTLLLDVGANTEVRPEYLRQFALMGAHYAERVLQVSNPRVGLLSIGEEDDKGSLLTQEAATLLRQTDLNFIGNVEGKDIPHGTADVIVTDGFTGNVYLKGAEGFAKFLFGALKQQIKARPLAMVGALLARGAFKALEKQLDYREIGGGILLGVNGIVVVAHGRSDALAIRNAIRTAMQAVERNVVAAIADNSL